MADQNFEKYFDLRTTQFPEVCEINEFETHLKIKNFKMAVSMWPTTLRKIVAICVKSSR